MKTLIIVLLMIQGCAYNSLSDKEKQAVIIGSSILVGAYLISTQEDNTFITQCLIKGSYRETFCTP